ncbi:MAG: beta-ketoacyl synthase N-terminal-like domain-containing protein [Myxococcales bacterium]|jgi:acyl transferase domain-containing protein/acyl-CoA synthetase (AMP-forming)/AMP-acid ligase II
MRRTIVERLRQLASERGDALAYIYLDPASDARSEQSFRELAKRARAVASALRVAGLAGKAVLLVCPSGPDYVAGLLGCLEAGALAVPAYPPGGSAPARALARIAMIADDCRAEALLTTSLIGRSLTPLTGRMPAARVLCVDTLDGDGGPVADPPAPHTPAILQYTSGSTSAPRGVVITHANLAANQWLLQAATGLQEWETGVSWLPPYHDMGLMGGLLNPLWAGATGVILPPEAFLRRPLRWLEAITRYRAAGTAAPNFAYDLCVRRIRPEQRAALDLSTLRVAYCGAEPINPETLDRFTRAFAPHGFRREAFYPSYGMAEATLIISGGAAEQTPVIRAYRSEVLERGRAEMVASRADERVRPLVGCGAALPGEQIRIVDPDTREELSPGEVGEIWVQSPSVAAGYWERPEETAHTFDGRLADSGEGPFLRTGDLGFFDRGELFVAGRLKDLIIVRGRNHHPQDIERTVQSVHPALLPDAGAAFAELVPSDRGGGEALVVVQEVQRNRVDDLDALLNDISRAIQAEHDIGPAEIVLIRKGSAWKTSSGKIRRRATKAALRAGELRVVAHWEANATRGSEAAAARQRSRTPMASIAPPAPSEPLPEATQSLEDLARHAASAATAATPPETPSGAPPRHITFHTISSPRAPESDLPPPPRTYTRPVSHRREQVIVAFLREKVAEKLDKPLEAIDPTAPLADHGIDSMLREELTGELEEFLQTPLPTTLTYDNATIVSLARALARAEAGQTTRPRRPTPFLSAEARRDDDPIAIVGMACRFPGAQGIEAFWRVLRHGVETLTEVPAERWDARALHDPRPGIPGKMCTTRGGFVEGIELFDAGFFGISAHEAARMDPQQRIFLEVAWEALEDAGQSPAALADTDTGVFAAVSTNDYAILYGGNLDLIDVDYGTGNSPSLIANRVSYCLDLKGPSETVDAACASSLVALQHACQSLRAHDCEVALVGGVNAVLAPESSVYFSQLRTLSPSGRCHTFDRDADGFVRGEGCGVVVLKRLSRAAADGDRVYALVAGSAVNHDGRSNGLTAPNGLAQGRVIRKAMRAAGIGPDDLDYVEAHGVGAPVADMVELHALGESLAERTRAEPVLVGSAKTNVGHLESASGMVGLIKAALALHHEEIPAHLHLRDVHPDIGIERLPLDVPTVPHPWRRGARPRFAGVSTFGFGGTNAHAVLREAPQKTPHSADFERGAHVFVLSARSSEALRLHARHHAAALRDQNLADVCYTAAAGRSHFAHRLAMPVSALPALRDALRAFANGPPCPGLRRGEVPAGASPQVLLAFTDLTPAPGHAHRLHDVHPEFRQALLHCDAVLRDTLDAPLLTILYGADAPLSARLLEDEAHRRACAVALQYGLCALLLSWGVEPAAVFGAGAGEYAAAAACGAMSWEEALQLAALSGRVVAGLTGTGPRSATPKQLRDALDRVDFRPPGVPMVSASADTSFDGTRPPGAEHFARQLYHNPRPDDGAGAVAAQGCELALEIGDGGQPEAACGIAPGRWHTLLPFDSPLEALLDAVAALYTAGADLDWVAFDRPYPRVKLPLPTYPFERQRHWLEFPARSTTPPPAADVVERASPHPLISRMRVRTSAQSRSVDDGERGSGDGEGSANG